jgi:hypothetical protein
LLTAIHAVKNDADILMFATDGVWSRVPLQLPKPVDTGTFGVSKPLGGWEEKVFPRGVFCVRPGVYFPINPTAEEIDEVRARGLGKRVLYERWGDIVDAWDNREACIELRGLTRFVGIKSALSKVMLTGGQPQGVIMRSVDYGEWVDHKIILSFNPQPKRRAFVGPLSRSNTLEPWPNFNWESEPYKKAIVSPEAELLKRFETIANEQPGGDFSEVDGGPES